MVSQKETKSRFGYTCRLKHLKVSCANAANLVRKQLFVSSGRNKQNETQNLFTIQKDVQRIFTFLKLQGKVSRAVYL